MKIRWITENSVIVKEMVHQVKKHKGKIGLMIMKIDMKKAYDSMEWSFIIWMLKAWGFCNQFQQLIYNCMNSVTFNLLLNGCVAEKNKPSHGFQQGDHLSPLLFILGLEVLSRLLGNEKAKRQPHGIKVNRNFLSVGHLMYADDLLVMARVDMQEADSFRSCFDTYCLWSGQEASLEKSSIYFSKCT